MLPKAKAGILASWECLFKAHTLCSRILYIKPKKKHLKGKNEGENKSLWYQA